MAASRHTLCENSKPNKRGAIPLARKKVSQVGLLDWGVVITIASSLLFVALIMLQIGDGYREFRIAKVGFLLTALVLFARTAYWAWDGGHYPTSRLITAALTAAGLMLLLMLAWKYADDRQRIFTEKQFKLLLEMDNEPRFTSLERPDVRSKIQLISDSSGSSARLVKAFVRVRINNTTSHVVRLTRVTIAFEKKHKPVPVAQANCTAQPSHGSASKVSLDDRSFAATEILECWLLYHAQVPDVDDLLGSVLRVRMTATGQPEQVINLPIRWTKVYEDGSAYLFTPEPKRRLFGLV